MKSLTLAGLLCGSVAALTPLRAAEQFQTLRFFGDPNLAGSIPGELVNAQGGFFLGVTRVGGHHNVGTVFRFNPQNSSYQTLWSFEGGPQDGSDPRGILNTSDNGLFGTTVGGGQFGQGVLFRLNTNNFSCEVLHHFAGGANDGARPTARLIEASDGRLYGTTGGGGISNAGTVFRIEKSGANLVILRHFGGQPAGDGSNPSSRLLEANDGRIYGTTFSGGSSNRGTVFRLNKDGSAYSVLRTFTATAGDGGFPDAGLMQASDGLIYGTTSQGGSAGLGTIFKHGLDGSGYGVVLNFSGAATGAEPHASLWEGADGLLYGTATRGGAQNVGLVFKVSKAGANFAVLKTFTTTFGEGRSPISAVALGSDGLLYGTTTTGGNTEGGVLFRVATSGSSYSIRHHFSVSGPDSAEPNALAEASDGLLYGTAASGGTFGSGTVFKIAKEGTNYGILRIFDGTPGSPNAPNHIIAGSDGILYGTTRRGGSPNGGTVFKMNRDGSGFAVLWELGTLANDGTAPNGIVEGTDGRLYGTTRFGGLQGAGVVFGLNKNGTARTVLRHLGGAGDGGIPEAKLAEGPDGRLYGTAFDGGNFGFGTVFRLNKDGSAYSILRHFGDTSTDARNPHGTLAIEQDGTLFGTTQSGGTNDSGTVFRLNTNGTGYSIVRSFAATGLDARHPRTGVTIAQNGMLYGASPAGGTVEFGTVYRLAKDGSNFQILHSFTGGGRDNADPGELLRTSAGLFGTTSFGGTLGVGQVYRISFSDPTPVPPNLTIQVASGLATLTLTGRVGDRYAIEKSGTLAPPWNEVGRVTNLVGSIQFQTPAAPEMGFFRARLNP